MKRVLFVFAWLVVGGEETEVRLLARQLDPQKYKIDVVACFRKPNMPAQTHEQLEKLGIFVDRQPYELSFDETVAYLAERLPFYDLVVACQAVSDIYPALEQLENAPPLIEHGGLVCEALAGPKHLTRRYVGVCDSIRQAAASRLPERPHHALEIPSMVDMSEFQPNQRDVVRQAWGIKDADLLIGWVGRLDRKKRVEDFIQAAALVQESHPHARFVIVGGHDAFMPEYADELHGLADALGLQNSLIWAGESPDVPRLLAGFDIFVWLSQGEGMPHVIAEAGAACLPVVATCDNGSAQQIQDGVSGLFVPHANPSEVAKQIARLIEDPLLRYKLGSNLHQKVQTHYSASVVVKRWEALFDEVIAETPPRPSAAPLTDRPTLYAIGDNRFGWPPAPLPDQPLADYRTGWQNANINGQQATYLNSLDLETARQKLQVVGGYLERLPLACLKYGLVDYAEKWTYERERGITPTALEQPLFGYRGFHLPTEQAPFYSRDMRAFLEVNGAPHILCVWGLGVSEEILMTCRNSFKVYYSIDAPPLRIPAYVSRHFDLILVGAEWQRQEVLARHPAMACEILTIGPEFADAETFRPLNIPKEYDLIYVGAAQPYKRHDILFTAMQRSARPLRALCVFGHGELADDLRRQADHMELDVDFVGPPPIGFEEVNYHMNRARIGVVAGVRDGCPAILTEYMLAGLPVLANSELCCGLRFINAKTGLSASADDFHIAIETILDRYDQFEPRAYALEHCGWPTSVKEFAAILERNGFRSTVKV